MIDLQIFAEAGTLVNATGNTVNAYTGETRDATLSECYLGKLPECDAPERFDHFRDVLRRLTARHDALLAYPESREECELLEPVIRDVQAILDQES